MKSKQPEIPARYYARMLEILQRTGLDLTPMLRAARIRPELIRRPDATLSLDQVEAMVTQATKFVGREDLGHDLGRALKLSSHSIVGYGILSSPNLDYALRLTSRYFRLIMPTFRMRYTRNREHIEIDYQPTLSMSRKCLALHLEAIAVATHWEVRELLHGHMPRYDLYLSIAEPPHSVRYAELSEARCHFGWRGAPGLRMVLPASIAASPLALADPSALKMAELRCATLVRDAIAAGHVSDWVSMMFREASEGMPSLTELAHTLNLSPRTLDRYLRREGVGFRELAKRERHRKACALLDGGGHTVTQIAYELGYTDAANFTRAFRREGRLSPSDYRMRQR
jgi:AraC-like DNA-binding protein